MAEGPERRVATRQEGAARSPPDEGGCSALTGTISAPVADQDEWSPVEGMGKSLVVPQGSLRIAEGL